MIIVTAQNGMRFRWWFVMKDGTRSSTWPLAGYKLADIDHSEYERLP